MGEILRLKLVEHPNKPPPTKVMSAAAYFRAEALVEGAVRKAVDKIPQISLSKISLLSITFERILKKNCSLLISAAETPPSIKKIIEDAKQAKAKARCELAQELKSARKTLLILKDEILAKEIEMRSLINREFCYKNLLRNERNLPLPPEPTIIPHEKGDGIPQTSGIYFLWDKGTVAYVGQSVNLNNRVRLGSHHRLQPSDIISYIEVPKEDLNKTEFIYIAALWPKRNGPCKQQKSFL